MRKYVKDIETEGTRISLLITITKSMVLGIGGATEGLQRKSKDDLHVASIDAPKFIIERGTAELAIISRGEVMKGNKMESEGA